MYIRLNGIIMVNKPPATIDVTQLPRKSVEIHLEQSEAENIKSEDRVTNKNDAVYFAAAVDAVDVVNAEVAPEPDKRIKTELNRINSMDFAGNKNMAEGLMDIALLSANANQLRFLLTYNDKARTYFISLSLVGVSLILQIVVGLALIFKRHLKRNDHRYVCIKEFLICVVFVITVVNVLLAAFTTTENV